MYAVASLAVQLRLLLLLHSYTLPGTKMVDLDVKRYLANTWHPGGQRGRAAALSHESVFTEMVALNSAMQSRR